MTEKRFAIAIDSNNLKSLWDKERTEEEPLLWLNRDYQIGGISNVCKLLNKYDEDYNMHRNDVLRLEKENEQLKKENKEIKQLLHTIIRQVEVEDIGLDSIKYSAKIIFTMQEFKKIRKIYKGD